MRPALGLWLVALAIMAGCASTPSNASTGSQGPSASVASVAKARAACVSVRKVRQQYGSTILSDSPAQVRVNARTWSDAISRAARGVADETLRTALLGLADVVRAWADRPPDRSALRGYQNDLDVACRPYLSAS